ncbi:MAG: hypothetical protein KGL40_03920 [Rhodocyclaceae bacterium]|nr:hypothetical protein [Rhodocyclaceae bacterium]
MKAHIKYAAGTLLLAATTAGAQIPPPKWQAITVTQAQYVCGGVSAEGMDEIKALRNDAVAELLFTSGPDGAFLADVAITINGGDLKDPLLFITDGPICLLKLAKGSYTVDANYRGKSLKQQLKIDGGARQQLKFNWPSS